MSDESKAIVLCVAAHMGVAYDDIMSPCKRPPVVRARDIATLMVRRRMGLSYHALSRLFGNGVSAAKNAVARAIYSKDAQDTIRAITETL